MRHLEQFKKLCVACGSQTNTRNKEHPFPQWLIKLTQTDRTSIRWLAGKRIPASGATLPLCKICNTDFGNQLEFPMSRLLNEIEAGKGLSDNDVELLIRWLWKLDGLLWHVAHPTHAYSTTFTLRQRVLLPINEIRGSLIVGIALCEEVDPYYGDAPMGLDSENHLNAIFVSGVFSRTAMLVSLDAFEHLIPPAFAKYRLLKRRDESVGNAKLFFPKTVCRTDTDLAAGTKMCSRPLQIAHEHFAMANQ